MPVITRRGLVAASLLATSTAWAADTDAWGFSVPSIEGGTLDFGTMRGRVLLVVNTASFCGFAPQFTTLEKLHRDRGADGLTVIGMPSNDFDQEADNNAKVKELCELTYGVEFPMAGLTHVTGKQANPFYAWVHQTKHWEPNWNFNKVLIGRDGRIQALFRAPDEPDGRAVQAAIGQALSATV